MPIVFSSKKDFFVYIEGEYKISKSNGLKILEFPLKELGSEICFDDIILKNIKSVFDVERYYKEGLLVGIGLKGGCIVEMKMKGEVIKYLDEILNIKKKLIHLSVFLDTKELIVEADCEGEANDTLKKVFKFINKQYRDGYIKSIAYVKKLFIFGFKQKHDDEVVLSFDKKHLEGIMSLLEKLESLSELKMVISLFFPHCEIYDVGIEERKKGI